MPSHEERFWAKVDKSQDCWEWKAGCTPNGYGKFLWQGRHLGSHRVSWVLHTGKWPEQDQVVCHKCDNRKCVRPNHLFIGTQKDNFDDMVFKGRAVFARGEAKNFAKLTEVAVRAIRAAYRPGEVRHKDLAAQYGVSQGLISMILARKIWTHI